MIRRWSPWAVLLASALAVFGYFLYGWIPVGIDNSLFYAPIYSLGWQGGPPLWNPSTMAGTALADNLQSTLLYPPRWPFYFIADWRGYFGLFNFLHYLIALGGMAMLMRRLGAEPWGSVGAALAYGLGGHMAGRLLNPAVFFGCSWLPWLLCGALGTPRKGALYTALGLSMILWIGSPHMIFYGGLAWGLMLLTQHRWGTAMRQPAQLRALVLPRLAALAIALVLGAPTLVPGVLRASQSVRTGAEVERNLSDSTPPADLPAVFLGGTGAAIYPEYIDRSCYVGALGLVLAAWAMGSAGAWRDRRRLGALAMAATGLWLAMGIYGGVHLIYPHVPGLRNLAGATRALILCVMGLAILIGLGVDDLQRRSWKPLAWTCLGLGAASAVWLAILTWNQPADAGQGPYVISWLRAWAAGVECVRRPIFGAADSAVGLLAAAGLLMMTGARPRLRMAAVLGLLFVMLWHFSPRVLPPAEKGEYFDPPPQVAWLQEQTQRQPQAPFRIACFDPLRMHDSEFYNNYSFEFLIPNLAGLYGLEDINGFDPLIRLDYLDLFLKTAGRAPYNDPLRNLDFDWPAPRLLEALNVRYLLGHPYHRRLTHLPMTLSPQWPAAPVQAWDEHPAGQPITHWLFVSLLDGALDLPPGQEVARLRVIAEEGEFSFPIRNAVETADIYALNRPALTGSPGWQARINTHWKTHQPVAELDYVLRQSNFRGQVDFGRALHVQRVGWEVTQPGLIFNIAAQAYRLARPAPAEDPWRLAHGDENDVVPVFEYTRATPRARLVDGEGQGAEGDIQWLERGTNRLQLKVHAPDKATLVLREIWDQGWQATINGQPAAIARHEGLFRALEVPAGDSLVEMRYRPRLFLGLLALAGALAAALGLWGGWRYFFRAFL